MYRRLRAAAAAAPIAVALIAFLLLRLAHEASKIVESPLAFAGLVRANLMQRRPIAALLQPASPPQHPSLQAAFDFGSTATIRRKRCRTPLETAA